jgi:hypothetical protein
MYSASEWRRPLPQNQNPPATNIAARSFDTVSDRSQAAFSSSLFVKIPELDPDICYADGGISAEGGSAYGGNSQQ